jgi:ribosomal protein L1
LPAGYQDPSTLGDDIRTLDGLPLPSFVAARHRDRRAAVPLADAIREVKAAKRRKFDPTVELAVNLGIDPRRGDQMVRGAVALPHGTGRAVRVAVFAQGEAAAAARAAGAAVVGGDDLIADIQAAGGGGLAFDKCVATPDMMPRLGRIARILGPRGLMPNPKLGTVTQNVGEAVAAVKRGRVEFRADKGGVLHAGIGKASFDDAALADNAAALAAALLAARPKGVKGSGAGGYLLKATLSSTMGPGVPVALPSLVAAAQAARVARGDAR